MKINNRKLLKIYVYRKSLYIRVLNSWKGSGISVVSLNDVFSFLPDDKSPPTTGRGKVYSQYKKIL